MIFKNFFHIILKVIECAQNGYKATGVELNFPLVVYSKFDARLKGVSSMASFYRKNIFKADLKPYKMAILFAAENMVFFFK